MSYVVYCLGVFHKLSCFSAYLQNISVSLALPDSWSEREIMAVLDVLLKDLGFKEAFVHKVRTTNFWRVLLFVLCVNLLIHGFLVFFFTQESVLTCFGAGLASACVVDIGGYGWFCYHTCLRSLDDCISFMVVGAETTQVCCVEEGQVVPCTSHLVAFGGRDVTELLLSLLQNPAHEHFFGWKNIRLNDLQHFLALQVHKASRI